MNMNFDFGGDGEKDREADEGTEFLKKRFAGVDYTDRVLSGREYVYCEFSGCNFSQTNLSGTAFDNCVFTECNITNPVVKGAKFPDCSFGGCKMLGINFCNCSQLSLDITVKNSRLMNCNFSGLKMKKSVLAKCIIEECYFDDTFLVEVDFSQTVFRSTLFHRCDLQKTNFEGAEGYAINPLTNKIQKARFTLPGVLSLLDYFNIFIK